jgi:hypothetical protein
MFLDGKKIGVIEYEMQFWTDCIGKNQTGDDLYRTTLDTTFALYNKKYFNPYDRYQAIRVAGKFTTKHLGGLRESIVPLEEIDFYKSYLFEGHISFFWFLINIFSRIFLRLAPKFILKFVYKMTRVKNV